MSQRRASERAAENAVAGVLPALDQPEGTRLTAFVEEAEGELLGYALNPTISVQTKIRERVRPDAEAVQARTLVAYVPGRKPDDYELAYAPIETFPTLVGVLGQIEEDTPLPLLDLEAVPRGGLRAGVTSLRVSNPGWVHLFKALRQTSQLRRSKRLALIRRGASYDEIDSDVVFFEPGLDAVVVDGLVLMTAQQQLERTLHAVEAAGRAAREVVERITDGLRIEYLPELLRAAQTDLNMIAKVRGIEAKLRANPNYAAAMTMDRIVPFIRERPELDIELAGEPGGERLVFRSAPSQRWKILKLLDDDYLHSLLTDADYEANSKSPL